MINPDKPDVIELIDGRQSADVSMSSLNDSCMSIEVEPTSEEMLRDAEGMLAKDASSFKSKMKKFTKDELISMLETKIVETERTSAQLKSLEPVSSLFVQEKVKF